jgi:hypothetical protein
MRKKLLFLAPFPNERYKMDGMISRIKSIDSFFLNDCRTYLYVSVRKNLRSYHKVSNNLEVYELNLFIHFFKIIKILFSSDIAYSHSIYQVRNIWFLLPFYKGKLFLDVHGVVPEEIKYFGGSRLSFLFMSIVEKVVFTKKNTNIICVTKAMQNHFTSKYKHLGGKFILHCIFPAHLKYENDLLENDTQNQFNDPVTIIYSGSSALWQKPDLMLDIIKKNQNNIKYIILTSDINGFESKIKGMKIDLKNIELKMVSPEELTSYYRRADFGFLLRDDNIVNRVAAPTKLIEYLSCGIIPIVISPNIGDYLSYGYEFLTLDNFTENSVVKPKTKSKINISIARKLLNENNEINFRNSILEPL